jgi:hypothetical protein
MTATHAVWSHHGKYIYFNSTAEAEPAFYRVRITDHKPKRVASLTAVKRPTSQSFGSWTGRALDDALLVPRAISTYEIYLDWQLP